ncbi:hypothetical protein GGR53DRAFT_372264 [Hypoxylon sp. FL1150]|nr:hypothetical protein GGR53DRAFT_372264 [Hypoxylon sp. FL1150]
MKCSFIVAFAALALGVAAIPADNQVDAPEALYIKPIKYAKRLKRVWSLSHLLRSVWALNCLGGHAGFTRWTRCSWRILVAALVKVFPLETVSLHPRTNVKALFYLVVLTINIRSIPFFTFDNMHM